MRRLFAFAVALLSTWSASGCCCCVAPPRTKPAPVVVVPPGIEPAAQAPGQPVVNPPVAEVPKVEKPAPKPKDPPKAKPKVKLSDLARLGPGDLREGAKGVLFSPGTDRPWAMRVVRVGSFTDILVESTSPPFRRFILRGGDVDRHFDGEIIVAADDWVEVEGTASWGTGTYIVVYLSGRFEDDSAAIAAERAKKVAELDAEAAAMAAERAKEAAELRAKREAEAAAFRAKLEAEVAAKNRANKEAYDAEVLRLTAKHEEDLAKHKAAAAAHQKAIADYESAKAEHDAAVKLAAARTPPNASASLKDVYRKKQAEIVKAYPGTDAARDAQALLDGKFVGSRKLPPEPVPPVAPTPPVLVLPPPPEPVRVLAP
jgi:hypothetical protein